MLMTMYLTVLFMLIPLKMKSSWEMMTIALMTTSMITTLIMQPSSMPHTPYMNMMTDSMSLLMMILSMWITSLMLMSSYKTKKSTSNNLFKLNLYLLLITLLMCFSVNNIILFYVSFETSLIPTVLLIMLWGYQGERVKASFYIMVYTITTSLPLLMLILKMTSLTSHMTLTLLYLFPMPVMTTNISWLMIMAAFLIKLPIFSMHLWLPKAHVEAPVAGSMILAAILLKLGAYGLVRMNTILNQPMFLMSYIITSLATTGAVVTNMMCARQTDLKALIAYSSVGHMGLLVTSTLSNSKLGQMGSLIIMLTHGLTSSCLFSMSNNIYEKLNTRNILLMNFSTVIMPSSSLMWMLMILTNMALPPSLNILGEVIIMMSSFFIMKYMIAMLMLTSFSTSVYSLYLYSMINHGNQNKLTNQTQQLSSNTTTTLFMHLWPLFIFTVMPTKLMML